MFGLNRGLALVVLAAVLWGTSGVSSQALYRLTETNSLSIAFFRLGIAAPVFVLVGGWLYHKKLFAIPLRDLGLMALVGAMLAVFQACYFAAIALVGVTIATLVTICSAPLLVLLLTVTLGHERPNRGLLLSLTLTLTGTVLLVGVGDSTFSTIAWQGVLLSLVSAFGYACMTILGRKVARQYPPMQVNAVVFLVGTLLLLLVALPNGLVIQYPPQGWVLLLYLGLIPTALGYALFMTGMQTTPASIASILTLAEPLTATLLAVLLFGERLGTWGLLGGCLMLAGLLILSRGQR
jgi:drug/metabolite transporter, DME family